MSDAFDDRGRAYEFKTVNPRRFLKPGATVVVFGGVGFVNGFRELALSERAMIICDGHVSRAYCRLCAPTPVARRIFRELETASDRAFLSRFVPELLD